MSRTLPTEVDRRPWLILSRREAEALYAACVAGDDMSEDLGRALRQIRLQIQWIEEGSEFHRPSITNALRRQKGGE